MAARQESRGGRRLAGSAHFLKLGSEKELRKVESYCHMMSAKVPVSPACCDSEATQLAYVMLRAFVTVLQQC